MNWAPQIWNRFDSSSGQIFEPVSSYLKQKNSSSEQRGGVVVLFNYKAAIVPFPSKHSQIFFFREGGEGGKAIISPSSSKHSQILLPLFYGGSKAWSEFQCQREGEGDQSQDREAGEWGTFSQFAVDSFATYMQIIRTETMATEISNQAFDQPSLSRFILR